MGINGEGIGYRNRRPVFCPGVLPSETAEVEITESESTFDRARLKQILVPAASRIQPVCPYQKQCGGCPLMILPHSACADSIIADVMGCTINLSAACLPNRLIIQLLIVLNMLM